MKDTLVTSNNFEQNELNFDANLLLSGEGNYEKPFLAVFVSTVVTEFVVLRYHNVYKKFCF